MKNKVYSKAQIKSSRKKMETKKEVFNRHSEIFAYEPVNNKSGEERKLNYISLITSLLWNRKKNEK